MTEPTWQQPCHVAGPFLGHDIAQLRRYRTPGVGCRHHSGAFGLTSPWRTISVHGPIINTSMPYGLRCMVCHTLGWRHDSMIDFTIGTVINRQLA